MDNNKEKKDKKIPLDESPVPHVHKGVAIVAICLFMAILVLPTLAWGGLMVANNFDSSIMTRFNPPTSEHLAAKTYAEFPTTFDPDTFALEVEAWYNDHLPFRSIIFNANGDMKSTLEKSYEEDLRPIFITMFNKNNNQQNATLDNSGQEEIFTDRQQEIETEAIEDTETETLPPDIVEETETKPIFETESEPELETKPVFEDETEPEIDEPIPEYPSSGEYFNPMAAPPSAGCTHDYVESVKVEPTCADFGVSVFTCGNCGGEETRYTAKSKEHDFKEVVLKEPTCTEWGIKGKQCSICRAVTGREAIDMAAHDYKDYRIEPTCSEWGEKGQQCSVCQKKNGREAIDKLAHTLTDVVVEATCTENGFVGQQCTVCEKLVSGKYSAKLSHNYPSVRPLCGESYEGAKCTLCGKAEFEGTKVAMHEAGKRLETVDPTVATYGYTLIECKHCGGSYRTNIKGRLADDPNFTPFYRSTEVLEGRYRWLFYLGDSSQAYYNGTNQLTDDVLQEYIDVLVTLNGLCKAQGKTLQISIWPNKDQVYPEYTGLADVGYENKRVYKYVDYIQKNTDVRIIYPIEELMAAKPYLDVYCMYDTHWNTAGGFIGYQALLESLGLETMNVLDCPVYEYTGGATYADDHYYTQLKGDMLGKGGWSFNAADYPAHRNYYIKYRPEVEFKFVDGTNGKNGAGDIRHTVSDNATYDKNFVMLADSYRVMQLGYLEKDFSDCYLCHRNQVNDPLTQQAIKDADIISIAAVERYDSNIIATANTIIKILSGQ